MTEIPIVVSDDVVTVGGYTNQVELQLSVGATGERGSRIFTGSIDPTTLPTDSPIWGGYTEFKAGDIYLLRDTGVLEVWEWLYASGEYTWVRTVNDIGGAGGSVTLDADLDAIADLTGTGLARRTAPNTWTLDTTAYLTSNQTVTLSGDVSGSGTTSIVTTVAGDSHSHTGATISALDAGSVTTGTFNIARIPTGTTGTTVALGNHTHSYVSLVSSTDNAIARFDGTGGALQNSGVTIDDSNNITTTGSIYANGTASVDPFIRVRSEDGRTPYLVLQSIGAQDVYMGWTRGNTTRFYMRCTQDDWTIRSADDTGNIWGSAPYGNVFKIDRTTGRITLGGHTTGKYEAGLEFGTSGPREMVGTGSPEGAVTAPAGSVWRQTDHATFGYVRWIKGSGTGNTGWLLSPEGRIWCEGRRTSNQSISDVTSTVITYTAETDRWNMLNTGTGKITLPVAGLWEFSAQISWATDFANWQHASILNETAGTTVASLRTASGPYQVSLSGLMSCSASDVMSVSVFQDSTGSQNVAYARFVANLVGT